MRFPGFTQISTSDVRGEILHSEQIRVLTVSACALIAAIVAFIRVSLSERGFGEGDFPGVAALLLLAFVVYELTSLVFLRKRLAQQGLPNFLKAWLDALMEGCLPFILGAVAILDTYADPYIIASGPLVMAALLLVILSVLRLNPWMSLACGGGATIAYAAMVLWIHISFPVENYENSAYRFLFYPIAISLLAGSTAVAIVIAGQSRAWLRTAWVAAENLRKRREAERELQLASDIQRELFPHDWPDGGVFDLAASSRPATELGGDFYDWMPVSEDRILLCLADVTGHGAASAILGAEGRAYFRASAPESEDLLELVERTEKLLNFDLRGGRFITMLLVLLHIVDGSLRVYSAGQGPVLILRASGSIDDIEVQRAPLGVPWSGATQVTEVKFSEGDVLVAVSDGVLDRVNKAGRALGKQGLMEILQKADRSSARGLVDEIFRAADDFAQGVMASDDSSVVVVRHTGVSVES